MSTRIINCPWHVAHQAELLKVPDTEWYQIINTVRKWTTWARPDSPNRIPVPHYEPGKYDVAVLHIDQQCVDPSFGKSRLFRELNECIRDVPKIIINHGTPFWPEQMESDEIIAKMHMLIPPDAHVVYNSERAQEMWESKGPMGATSRTIIHGLDIDEWRDLPKEPRVITTLSKAGLNKYYNRTLLLEVQSRLKERGIPHVWIGGDWESKGFEDYKEFIGRSLVYFNPTLESPMPRSRTEAMLSGACVVTLPNHGAEKFIEHGVNGIHVPNNPDVCADLLENLVRLNYRRAEQIGHAGKMTAREIFTAERFQNEWRALLNEVIGI